MWKRLSSYLTPPKAAPPLFRDRENSSHDVADLLELTSWSKAASAETELHDVARCFEHVKPQHEDSEAEVQDPLSDKEQLQHISHSAGSVTRVLAELLSTSQLWPADEDESEAAAITREERTLRCWINSLLHGSGRVSSGSGGSMMVGGGGSMAQLQPTSSGSSSLTPPPEASTVSKAAGSTMRLDSTPPGPAFAAVHGAGGAAVAGSRVLLSSSGGGCSTSGGGKEAAWSGTRSISSLFGAEVRSGVLLLELLDLLQPGCVDWKRANKPPFKGVGLAAELQAQENCQLALRIAQEELGLPLDPVLSSGVVLLQLLHTMAPEAVDLSFVTPGLTAEQRQSNARYTLAVAEKIGCSLFLVWEDLVGPQPRMLVLLLASLMYLDQKLRMC
eukprot:gene3484-3754_t